MLREIPSRIQTIWIICRRDFRSYFTSPIAYIVIAGFMGIMGWMFFFILDAYLKQSGQMQQYNFGKAPSISDAILKPLFGNMNVILLFLVPFLTMRLFAEERKNQTIALLLTSPTRLLDLVLGKFFSAFLLVLVMLVFTSVYPIILVVTGNPDMGPIISSYVGTILIAACYLGLGTLFSAMTENQIVAGAITFAACLSFWLISWASQSAGGFWGDLLQYLSLISHFNNFSSGTINSADVIFYLSFCFVSLFLCHRILDSYRWR